MREIDEFIHYSENYARSTVWHFTDRIQLDIFDINDILVFPIVTINTYVHINNGYNNLGWDMTKYKRKDFNYTIACL